jgi:hypothetical protein
VVAMKRSSKRIWLLGMVTVRASLMVMDMLPVYALCRVSKVSQFYCEICAYDVGLIKVVL